MLNKLLMLLGGLLLMTFHSPNDTPNERPVFVAIEEAGDGFELKA